MASPPEEFAISADQRDGSVQLTLRGELDLATAPELEQLVNERIDAGDEVVVTARAGRTSTGNATGGTGTTRGGTGTGGNRGGGVGGGFGGGFQGGGGQGGGGQVPGPAPAAPGGK